MASNHLIQAKSMMSDLNKQSTKLMIGTMFTGCEVFYFTLHLLVALLNQNFGVNVETSLEWTVDNVRWKRDYVNARSPPKFSFGDAIELSQNEWRGTDHISNEPAVLYPVHICAIGFECDTVSKLSQVEGREHCIETQSGKTGKTGRATLLCITKFRFPLSLLENSAILGKENIRFITDYLNFFGIIVYAFTLCAKQCRSGVARERQYMLVVPLQETPLDQNAEGYKMPDWVMEFAAALQSLQVGVGDPNSVLMDRDDPHYVMWHQMAVQEHAVMEMKELEKKAVAQAKKKAKTEESVWRVDHLEEFRDAGLQWPPCLETDRDLDRAVAHLPRRMQEVAWYFCHNPKYQLDVPTYHDLNPSITLKSCSRINVMTLVCNSVVWDRQRKRVLWGAENMMLQGLPLDIIMDPAYTISNAQMTEMAGNMFNAFAIGTILASVIATVPLASIDQAPDGDLSEYGDDSDGCFEGAETDEGGEEDSDCESDLAGE